jgi:exopolysaccharide production protein ExoQ
MTARYSRRRRPTAVLMATSLVATVAASAIAASMDALALLIVILLALAALAVAVLRPTLLFYVYCASIPLNFALPPGPAGTIARIAGVAFFVGYLIRRPDSLQPATVPLAGWLFVAWALASSLWAIDTQTAYGTWLSVAQLFAITVLIASLVAARPEVVGNALWWYAISATFTAGVGILSYLQGAASSFGRGTAFADQDPALFASVLLPAAVFLMGEAQSRTNRTLLRVLAAGALIACVVALALSGTRSAWIGILVAIVVWVIVQREPRQMLAVAALSCGVVILVASVPGIGDFLLGRAQLSLATGAGRTDIWVVGLGMLAAAPLLGVGFGNFPLAFTPYAIAQASAASGAGGALFAGRGPHNVLLGISVETGVVGGLLLVAFFASALLPSTGDRTRTMVRVALIGLFVQSMFLDILLQKQLWLFLAMAFGLASSQRLDRVRGRQQPTASGHLAPLARRLT